MAEKLRDDHIRWILSLDAGEVQKEFREISSVINKLTKENKDLEAEMKAVEKQINTAEREMRKLEAAGAENSRQYRDVQRVWKDAKIELVTYSKKVEDNKNAILKQNEANKELLLGAKLTDLTFRQLKQRAEQLEKQMQNTVKSLQPEVWKKLQDEHKDTIHRMEELNGKTNTLTGTLGSMLKSKLSIGAFVGNIYTKAAEMAAQALVKVKELVNESIELAKKAEGIDKAFYRISNNEYLEQLRKSTHGLVNDMELMKAAVKADNFNIPLEKLGTLLSFAQQRAKDTGESIDYLVTSIVNGIGRKSPRIIDNLGISQVKLNEEIKKTGDFASAVSKIVEEEMAKSGKYIDTAADAANRKAVAWENMKLAMGKYFLGATRMWDNFSTSVADALTKILSKEKSASEQYDDQIKKVADLEVNTGALAHRYDQLKSKTHLNKNEQIELNRIMNKISQTIPGVTLEFDKYGNALSINTQKVYEFIEAEKAKLQYMNKDAIKKTEKDKKDYEDKLQAVNNALARGTKSVTVGASITGYVQTSEVAYKPEEMDNLRKQQAKLKGDIEGANAYLKDLTGKTIEEQVKGQKTQIEKRNEFNMMSKKQLAQFIKMHKDSANQYIEIAKDVYKFRFSDGEEDTSKADKAAQKAANKAAEEAKRLAEQQAKAREQILEDTSKQLKAEERDYNVRLKNAGIFNKEIKDLTKEQLDERLRLEDEHLKNVEKITISAETARYERLKKDAGIQVKKNADGTDVSPEESGLKGDKLKAYEVLYKEHQAMLTGITLQSEKERADIQKTADAAILKNLQEHQAEMISLIDAGENIAILNLKQDLSEKRITQEQYNKELKEIEAKALADRLSQQKEYLEALKKLTNPTEDQKKAIETAEAAIRATEAKIYDEKINDEKSFQDRRKALMAQYGGQSIWAAYKAEKEALDKARKENIINEEEHQRLLLLLKLKYANEYIQKGIEKVNEYGQIVQAFKQAETAEIQAQYEQQHAALKQKLDAGLISQEEYNAGKEQLEYDTKAKELEVQKKYADAEFALKVANIGAALAMGIMNAWSSAMVLGPIAGPIAAGVLTGLLVATSAAQIKAAKAERDRVKAMTLEAPGGGGDKPKPLPEGRVVLKEKTGYADGGYTGDGGKYEVAGYLPDGKPYHRGEYFVAQEEMSNPRLIPLIQAIDMERQKRVGRKSLPSSYGYADGGFTEHNGPATGGYVMLDEGLMVRFEKAVERFENAKLKGDWNYWEFKEVEDKATKIQNLSKK